MYSTLLIAVVQQRRLSYKHTHSKDAIATQFSFQLNKINLQYSGQSKLFITLPNNNETR